MLRTCIFIKKRPLARALTVALVRGLGLVKNEETANSSVFVKIR